MDRHTEEGMGQQHHISGMDHDNSGVAHPSLGGAADNSSIPKPKRLACMICRKRKLKCDGARPSCSTCSRLGHMCAYDEQRRKSGPKRGYVKALEERLKQVETLLKTQDPSAAAATTAGTNSNTSPTGAGGAGGGALPGLSHHHGSQGTKLSMVSGPAQMGPSGPNHGSGAGPGGGNGGNGPGNGPGPGHGADWDMDHRHFNGDSPQQAAPPMDDFSFNAAAAATGMNMHMNGVGGDFPWEMIGLGLEEPLPAQDTIDELHQIYFEKVHPSMPMIHKYRYLAAMNLAPNQRPPVCLRYAMWTMASSISDKYTDMKDLFYQRARKYVEADYIKGYGEHMISVAHCQTHILLSCYEMKMLYFPRAWISTGSAARLAQMIGLLRLDGKGLDVKQCLPSPKDWTEREERRRTFWMAFCEDRYVSIGTGWPMAIDERDIMTNLPASEEAFDMSRPEQTQSLQDSTTPSGAAKMSSFAAVVLMASLLGRNLIHLHRPDADDLDHDINGPFWKRHRHMDNIILNTSLCLPNNLKLPAGMSNPNVVFSNMSIHTATICLHQSAIFKAEKNKLPASVGAESKIRCITAANEIASIMRTVSHMDLAAMNPFISFCLYVSARVFVQYLKSRPDDSQTADALRFLLSAMNAIKRQNPLTESFLVQLDVDIEALLVRIPKLRNIFPRSGDSPGHQNSGGTGATSTRACDDPDGIQGIMAYRNDCNFGENPELREPSNEMQGLDASSSAGGFNSQAWLSAEHSMSGMTPSSGSMNGPTGNGGAGMSNGHGDGSGSQDDGADLTPASNGPGGNSNNSSGGGNGVAAGASGGGRSAGTGAGAGSGPEGRSHLVVGQLGDSGRGSYQASPVSPHQGMMSQGGQGQFFGDPGSFMTPQGGGFGMPSGGWGGMAEQGDMPAVGDGVLRALINMGPMNAMDLSTWNPTNENMRR